MRTGQVPLRRLLWSGMWRLGKEAFQGLPNSSFQFSSPNGVKPTLQHNIGDKVIKLSASTAVWFPFPQAQQHPSTAN